MQTDIAISQNIARMRKEQGFTQEDLATFLDVTKASVSKWECGQSFPDIALLPRIATYFGVSIDELMGYAPQMTKAQARATYLKLRDAFASEPFDDAHDACREIAKKYWSCPPLLVQLAVLYLNHAAEAPTGAKRDAFLKEAEGYCRRTMDLDSDSTTIRHANALLAALLLAQNRPDEAVERLEGALEPALGERSLLAQAYLAQGMAEEAERCTQVSIFESLVALMNGLPMLASLCASDAGRLEEAYVRTLAVIEAFEFEEAWANCPAVYATFAATFAAGGNTERAYECLEHYVHVVGKMQFPPRLHGDKFFDKVDDYLEDLDLGGNASRNEELIKKSAISGIEHNPAFAGIADEPRFRQLVADLRGRLQ